jgi:hypothetical protein
LPSPASDKHHDDYRDNNNNNNNNSSDNVNNNDFDDNKRLNTSAEEVIDNNDNNNITNDNQSQLPPLETHMSLPSLQQSQSLSQSRSQSPQQWLHPRARTSGVNPFLPNTSLRSDIIRNADVSEYDRRLSLLDTTVKSTTATGSMSGTSGGGGSAGTGTGKGNKFSNYFISQLLGAIYYHYTNHSSSNASIAKTMNLSRLVILLSRLFILISELLCHIIIMLTSYIL